MAGKVPKLSITEPTTGYVVIEDMDPNFLPFGQIYDTYSLPSVAPENATPEFAGFRATLDKVTGMRGGANPYPGKPQ